VTDSATGPTGRIRLWPDDARTPIDFTWTWVTTVADAIGVMEDGEVSEALP
jgi:hypothetical protein